MCQTTCCSVMTLRTSNSVGNSRCDFRSASPRPVSRSVHRGQALIEPSLRDSQCFGSRADDRLLLEQTVEEIDKQRIQIILAEFSALRKEIADRSSAAQTLLGLNATMTAAVAGFVLSSKADPRLLLLIPILSPSLGMLFVDHVYNVINIGTYIKEDLAPQINRGTGSIGLLGYEDRIDEYERRKWLRFLPVGVPLTLLFTLAPGGALLFSAPTLSQTWEWALWSFGLLLTALYVGLWVSFLLLPYRRRPESTQRPPVAPSIPTAESEELSSPDGDGR